MKKNTFIKKLVCALLCALMLGSTALAATGARMPAQRGAVTDDADVLSAKTAQDIEAYAEMLDDDADVKLHVALVHFLDGMDAQSYADALFGEWKLGKEDMLVLGAAGEDSFAVSMGDEVKEKLGEKSAEALMFTSSRFSDLFRSQRYDEAFGSFFIAFNSLVEKRYGETISLGKLFEGSQYATEAEAEDDESGKEYGSKLWNEVMNAIQSREDSYQDYHETRQRRSSGMGVGGWIVLGIIILIIFGQSDPVRAARKRGGRDYRRTGCGCSPLGWILSLFGINVLINNLRGKH